MRVGREETCTFALGLGIYQREVKRSKERSKGVWFEEGGGFNFVE